MYTRDTTWGSCIKLKLKIRQYGLALKNKNIEQRNVLNC